MLAPSILEDQDLPPSYESLLPHNEPSESDSKDRIRRPCHIHDLESHEVATVMLLITALMPSSVLSPFDVEVPSFVSSPPHADLSSSGKTAEQIKKAGMSAIIAELETNKKFLEEKSKKLNESSGTADEEAIKMELSALERRGGGPGQALF
eukprot:TRINITY_DN28778_c0_g1_i1.p2 TRINITY_DN28778_c0_g1~~TRINITY_DN28778_c0_g1_i1.p2  ORF type:complete len:151 (-),score=13.81 TRINITY_DN28778_c0_g1_i1:143-595(-)